MIDDEDALRELLDRAVAPPQVPEEILKAARTGRHARQLGEWRRTHRVSRRPTCTSPAGPFRVIATAMSHSIEPGSRARR